MLSNRPLKKFSELFQLAQNYSQTLLPALIEKAKSQEMSNRLILRTDRFNPTERQDIDIVELPDNDVSIELEVRFYTIAKYVGLIGS